MPKRHHSYAAGGHRGWSVDSNSLTSAGRSEVLKDLGRQLQQNYQDVLKEPVPDRMRHLVERLERARPHDEDEGR